MIPTDSLPATRLARIERKVDLILVHIAAIKAYREENNANLHDAEDAVEAIMDEMAR